MHGGMGIGIILQIIIIRSLRSSHKMLYFVNKFPENRCNARLVKVDEATIGKRHLFNRFNTDLSFPEWFGYNFDAFSDILSHLDYWIPEEEIRIIHDNMPKLEEQDMNNYLDVLNYVDARWSLYATRADIVRIYAEKHPDNFIHIDDAPSWWDKRPKIFNVYFQKKDERYVRGVLHNYSWDYRKCIHYDEKGNEDIDFIARYPLEG